MRKYLILFFILILFLAGIFFLDKASYRPFSTTEKEKALVKMLGREIREKEINNKQQVDYRGKYLSLKYPASAILYTAKNTNIEENKSILEHFRFDILSPRVMFVALVRTTSATGLDEVSDIIIRRKGSYKETSIDIDGDIAISFDKESDRVEKSVFFLKQGKLFSFVASGVSLDDVASVFDDVIASVKF